MIVVDFYIFEGIYKLKIRMRGDFCNGNVNFMDEGNRYL